MTQGLSTNKNIKTNCLNTLTNSIPASNSPSSVKTTAVKGVTERFKQTLAKHNVSLYSKPGYTLRNALVKPKDPLDDMEKCGVICKVGCEECGQVYVGETDRSLGERTLEHQKSLNREEICPQSTPNANRTCGQEKTNYGQFADSGPRTQEYAPNDQGGYPHQAQQSQPEPQ